MSFHPPPYPISLRYLGADSELMERITSVEHSSMPQATDQHALGIDVADPLEHFL
jgi:hypothetical protein